MKIKVHTKFIFNPTRIDLLILAQPCEKYMMHQVPWGRIQSHRKEQHFRVRTMVSWGEVLQLTSKIFWKQLYSKCKNKWEMYALKRCKTNVSTPWRLLIRSFRDFHNVSLCFV